MKKYMLLTKFYSMLDRVWPGREPQDATIKFVRRNEENVDVEIDVMMAEYAVHEKQWTVRFKDCAKESDSE